MTVFEEIKARINLADLIGSSVELKRVGSNYRARCPFHEEKTPSFYVLSKSNRWHCFGCLKTGDAFDWLVEHQNQSFPEALRSLADKANVNLDGDDQAARDHARRIYEILQSTANYYHRILHSPEGRLALDYLTNERGLSYETVNVFKLGFALPGRQLVQHLTNTGFSREDIAASGVANMPKGFLESDFMRDRIIFPIWDVQGRVVALGGRAISRMAQPKYLNTRESPVFHKQDVLYGFDMARTAIAGARKAVVVEGYMDVVTAHQNGYLNVVAPLGTALTDRHVRLLRPHVDEIVIAMDSDAAGKSATWRALQVADENLRNGAKPVVASHRWQRSYAPDKSARLSVLTVPNAKDPDELIRANPEQWPALVASASPIVQYVLDSLPRRYDFYDPLDKSAAATEIVGLLASIGNPVEQADYVQRAAEILDCDPLAIRQMLGRKAPIGIQKLEPNHDPVTGDEWDVHALAICVVSGDLTSDFPLQSPQARALAPFIDSSATSCPAELQELVDQVSDRTAGLCDLSHNELMDEHRRTYAAMVRLELLRERTDLLSLIRETHDATERKGLAQKLDDVSYAIAAQDRLVAQETTSGSTLARVS